jgi:hypothetical protein
VPSGRLLFWMTAVAVAVTFGVKKYEAMKAGQ